MYYRLTGDYQQCVKEYGELIARYAADVVGHNQRALCLTQLRDMRGAVNEMRQVVDMLPNRAIFRDNLALYNSYAGDFQTGEQEARAIQEPDVYAIMALAFAQTGQGQLSEAAATYQKLATVDALGASFAASGLGDLAGVEGRFADAVADPERGRGAGPRGEERRSRRGEVCRRGARRSSSRGRNAAGRRRRREGARPTARPSKSGSWPRGSSSRRTASNAPGR